MKSKTIVITTIFSLFLLLTIPVIPAVQTQTIESTIKDKISDETIQFIKEKIKEYKDQGLDLSKILFKIIYVLAFLSVFTVSLWFFTFIELWRQGFFST